MYDLPYVGQSLSQQMISHDNSTSLVQLQGMYEMDTINVKILIHVQKPLPKGNLQNQRCTIVRRVSADGSALPDQMIFKERTQFSLCTAWEMLTHTAKGNYAGNEIVWTCPYNVVFVWKRIARLDNISDMWSDFSCAALSSGISMYSSPKSMYSQFSIDNSSIHDSEKMEDEVMVDRIKTLCSERPNLLKRVLLWGQSNYEKPDVPIEMSPMRMQKLTSGRVWVSCSMLADELTITGFKDFTKYQHTIDNLKGAYHEEEEGSCIYVQPKPESQIGMWHRLRKVENVWLIEEYDSETQTWKLRARELSGINWQDVKHSNNPLRLKVFPLINILSRMSEIIFDKAIEKKVDFLFHECNHKKIAAKLKNRTFDSNIRRLKLKLQRLYSLDFAVQFLRVADEIAREHGIRC